jgi:hypothetical protein
MKAKHCSMTSPLIPPLGGLGLLLHAAAMKTMMQGYAILNAAQTIKALVLYAGEAVVTILWPMEEQTLEHTAQKALMAEE